VSEIYVQVRDVETGGLFDRPIYSIADLLTAGQLVATFPDGSATMAAGVDVDGVLELRPLEAKSEIRPDRYWSMIRPEDVLVIDGDTIEARVSLQFGVIVEVRVRLASINAIELRDDGGQAAKEFLENEIAKCEWIWLKTVRNKAKEPPKQKQKKTFDRYVGFLFDEFGELINQRLVDAGLAEPYMIEIVDSGDSFLVRE
jgi:endonuclease YncB( thermonuclease family)